MAAFLLNKAAAAISGSTVPVTTFGQTIPRGSYVFACSGAGAAGAVRATGVTDNSSQTNGDANVYALVASNNDGTNYYATYGCLVQRNILSTDTITIQFSGSLTRMAAHIVVFTRVLGTVDTSGTVALFASPINYSCGATIRPVLLFTSSVIATGTPTTSGYADVTSGMTPLVGVNTAQASVNVEVSCSWGLVNNALPGGTTVDAPTLTNMVSSAGALLAINSLYPTTSPNFPSHGKSVSFA